MLDDSRENAGEPVVIRPAQLADIDRCGRICYDAFDAISRQHGFQSDFKTAGSARQAIAAMFAHPRCYCLVAEQHGAVVGSNCMDERSSICGIGPITIDPIAQNAGIGARLMAAMLSHATERRASGVRLVQAAFHGRSMALYSKLSFIVRELMFVMQGSLVSEMPSGYSVRSARREDLEACNALCRQVHGHDRAAELADAIETGAARVVEFAGRISAYSTGVGFFGHSIAEGNRDLEALIVGAGKIRGPGIIVPSRNTAFLRWSLNRGLRILQPLTLMTIGFYNEPAGVYLPSILY
jgi:predicted N-acetyltransferase YhbS